MRNSKFTITIMLTLSACCVVVAQGGTPPDFEPAVDDVAPIPGIIAAAVVGLFIGARKMYNNRNK